MTTCIGKLFIAGLNKIKPVSKGWASPYNTGLKKFINGTQQNLGDRLIFQTGLKHKVLTSCYPNAMQNWHNVMISGNSTISAIKEANSRIPNCLHQAAHELSELMSKGAWKIS